MAGIRWKDRIAWAMVLVMAACSSASAQSPENPLGMCATPGALMLCGGGRMSEDVYREFLRLAGGEDAHIVLIPSAIEFSSPEAVRRRYSGWLGYNVASFTFLDAKSREEADTEAFAAPLKRATGVWIGGGSQGRLANLYNGTKTEAALKEVLERGGIVGGTSAGASIVSSCMIRHGSSTEAVCDQGLGLLAHCVVDQHFSQRNRLERLLGVLEKHQAQLGIGIDEETAVLVREDRLKVIGASRATICLPDPFSRAVTLYRLKDGEQVHLSLESREKAKKEILAWQLERAGD
jgi:cyanophycinase